MPGYSARTPWACSGGSSPPGYISSIFAKGVLDHSDHELNCVWESSARDGLSQSATKPIVLGLCSTEAAVNYTLIPFLFLCHVRRPERSANPTP